MISRDGKKGGATRGRHEQKERIDNILLKINE